jgi:hypothetical protein
VSDTAIVREAPRVRRTGGAVGFALPVPFVRARLRRLVDELRLAVMSRPLMLGALAVVGALLWPLTLVGLAFVVLPPHSVAEWTPSRAEVTGWYARAGLVSGTVVGGLQWFVMRRAVGGSVIWAPLTAVGWAMAMAAAVGGASEVSRWLRSTLYGGRFSFWAPEWERYVLLGVVGAVVGLTLGIAQWVALRRASTPLPRCSLWVAASGVAWAVGLAFVPVVPRMPDFVQRMGRYSGGFDYTLPALVLAGAFYGLLTGFALALLLRAAAPRPVET